MKLLLSVAGAGSQLLLAGAALAHSGHSGWIGHLHAQDYAAIAIAALAALVIVRRMRSLLRRTR